jgi:hypothetical protein
MKGSETSIASVAVRRGTYSHVAYQEVRLDVHEHD